MPTSLSVRLDFGFKAFDSDPVSESTLLMLYNAFFMDLGFIVGYKLFGKKEWVEAETTMDLEEYGVLRERVDKTIGHIWKELCVSGFQADALKWLLSKTRQKGILSDHTRVLDATIAYRNEWHLNDPLLSFDETRVIPGTYQDAFNDDSHKGTYDYSDIVLERRFDSDDDDDGFF